MYTCKNNGNQTKEQSLLIILIVISQRKSDIHQHYMVDSATTVFLGWFCVVFMVMLKNGLMWVSGTLNYYRLLSCTAI